MDKKLGTQAVTSDDMTVSGYRVIIGKSFGMEASPR
jgi:hypothetical protein